MNRKWVIMILLVSFVTAIILGNMFLYRDGDVSGTVAEVTPKSYNAYRMNSELVGEAQVIAASVKVVKDENCEAQCCSKGRNPEAEMKQMKVDAAKNAAAADNAARQNEATADSTKAKTYSGVYTCPMDSHSDVIQMGPGKCPKCGMELVAVEETSGRTFYICPMPEDSVASSKPGKCPKCGMELIEKTVSKESREEMRENSTKSEKESAGRQLSGVYTCPMDSHANIVQMGPGECPECGMELVPVEKTSGRTFYVCPMPADKVVSSKPGDCPKCGMKLIKKTVEIKMD